MLLGKVRGECRRSGKASPSSAGINSAQICFRGILLAGGDYADDRF